MAFYDIWTGTPQSYSTSRLTIAVSPPIRGARIPAALAQGGGAAWLKSGRLDTAGSSRLFIANNDGASELGFGSGPDLVQAWEDSPTAIRLTAAHGSVDLPGPGGADRTEPYIWVMPAAARQALGAWLRGYTGGTVTIAFDDGTLPVSVLGSAEVDAAATGRVQRLDRVAVQGAASAAATATARVQRLPGIHVAGAAGVAASAEGHVELRINPGARFTMRIEFEALHSPPASPATAGAGWRRAAQSLSADRGLLPAACIDHPDILEPACIVASGRDTVLGGRLYLGAPFTLRLGNDEADRAPRALLSIFWAGREMAALLEATDGAIGATCELSEWSFDPLNPDDYELEWRLKYHVVGSNAAALRRREIPAGRRPQALNLTLGVTPRGDRPAVSARYTPETDPWLFAA